MPFLIRNLLPVIYFRLQFRLDLRFIPDDMTFDQEPKDVCKTMPDAAQYEPRLFLTSALQQAVVHLTWDETDPSRMQTMQKLFKVFKIIQIFMFYILNTETFLVIIFSFLIE